MAMRPSVSRLVVASVLGVTAVGVGTQLVRAEPGTDHAVLTGNSTVGTGSTVPATTGPQVTSVKTPLTPPGGTDASADASTSTSGGAAPVTTTAAAPTPATATAITAMAAQAQTASAATMAGSGVGTVIGSARYPVPAGALYVASTGDDGAAGTVERPLRTLGAAVARAASGGTVVLRGGLYHESVTFYGKRLTIQNHPGEKVWLSGSRATTGWVADGTSWRLDRYSTRLSRTASDPRLVDKNLNPLAAHADMVFVDGVAQQQVASRSAVKPGTFFVDTAAARIYLGTSPRGHAVEVSDLTRALYINKGDGSVVRGIGVQRYANGADDQGALFAEADDVVLRDLVVRQNASIGATVIGARGLVEKSSFTDNGRIGLHGHKADGLIVRGCMFQHNNTEKFAFGWAEGGSKVTTSRGVAYSGNVFRWNVGRGLWFDISSYDLRVVRNVVNGNTDRGIQVEISAKAVVADNMVTNNGGDGLMIVEANDVDVYNNSFWRNARSVSAVENNRTNADPAIPYNLGDVVVRNNLFSEARPGAHQLVATEDVTRTRTARQLGVSLNYNHYHRPSGTSSPEWLLGWADYPGTYGVFSDLASFQTDSRAEGSGSYRQSTVNPFYVSPARGDFRLSSTVSSLPTAPLPANVASALGIVTAARLQPGASL